MRTPHLARENMYKTSGHLPYYAESMFPPMELKELNSKGRNGKPRALLSQGNELPASPSSIFTAVPHSYRDLPLRLAEYGTCYRYEQSGELFGLMRVRRMQHE